MVLETMWSWRPCGPTFSHECLCDVLHAGTILHPHRLQPEGGGVGVAQSGLLQDRARLDELAGALLQPREQEPQRDGSGALLDLSTHHSHSLTHLSQHT